jgi:beta-lactam-binding protein with PASTA domain
MSKRKRTDTEVEQSNKPDVDYSDTPIQQRLDLETERLAKLSLLNEQKQHVAVVQKEVDILTGSQNNKVQPSSNNESQNNRKKILEKVRHFNLFTNCIECV